MSRTVYREPAASSHSDAVLEGHVRHGQLARQPVQAVLRAEELPGLRVAGLAQSGD